jgi:hypothetical protein
MRELFQNAVDQEVTVPGNTMFWEYHEEIESFHIGNKLSILEPKSLLLGASTKADDSNTIGKFGEGYKVATLVLLRLGKKVTFYNYGAKEVWRARFSKSRKYGAEILVFEVDKKFPWAAVPNNNLTIVVEGITLEESLEIGETNLHMQEAYGYWSSPKGKILTDEDLKGKMFVNGLYICTEEEFGYGYDFKPDAIKLDRDRKLIANFDLKYTTAQMWVGFDADGDDWDEEAIEAASQLLRDDMPDTQLLEYTIANLRGPKYSAVSAMSGKAFKDEYGDKAVPVTSNDELNKVPSTHKAIMVSSAYSKAIKASPDYEEPELIKVATLQERLEEWLSKWEHTLPEPAVAELNVILEADDNDTPF